MDQTFVLKCSINMASCTKPANITEYAKYNIFDSLKYVNNEIAKTINRFIIAGKAPDKANRLFAFKFPRITEDMARMRT